MRLYQNQVWQQGEQYIRIVRLERKSVEYKLTKERFAGGPHAFATKKDFCRLLKDATLLPPAARIGSLPPPADAAK